MSNRFPACPKGFLFAIIYRLVSDHNRPCAGKTTLAKRTARKLEKRGYKLTYIDGDTFRLKITQNLGYSKKDRDENIKRAIGFAKTKNTL